MNAKLETNKEVFTKYEVARILGARALQIAMDAPLLMKIDKEKLEEVRYDPLKVAQIEFNSGVLPITVKRPFPKRIEVGLKRETEQKPAEDKIEKTEEKEIKETGEIMELTTPEDEVEETTEPESEEEAI